MRQTHDLSMVAFTVRLAITGQIEDDEIPDRIAAMIATIARSGIPCIRKETLDLPGV